MDARNFMVKGDEAAEEMTRGQQMMQEREGREGPAADQEEEDSPRRAGMRNKRGGGKRVSQVYRIDRRN